MLKARLLASALLLASAGCATTSAEPPAATREYPQIGAIHRASPALDALIAPDARIEKLAEGFGWSEGPVWIGGANGYLLFSDVPGNRIHRWSDADGLSTFLEPSGLGGLDPQQFREPGSNGLIRGPGNSILMGDHGNRAIARVDLATREKILLATHFQGRRFNSPNDLVRARDGSLYFTDPPYGLAGLDASPLKEQPHNGVYRMAPDGEITLLAADLTFPNGVILSPDERTLYVTNSDPRRAVVMAYALSSGRVTGTRLFADLTFQVSDARPGLPDGLATDVEGNIFTTGPGGVHVFTPAGQHLGHIATGTAIANCKFGGDGRTLYMTSHNMLARVRTRTRGLQP
jgi:gluconolactonase